MTHVGVACGDDRTPFHLAQGSRDGFIAFHAIRFELIHRHEFWLGHQRSTCIEDVETVDIYKLECVIGGDHGRDVVDGNIDFSRSQGLLHFRPTQDDKFYIQAFFRIPAEFLPQDGQQGILKGRNTITNTDHFILCLNACDGQKCHQQGEQEPTNCITIHNNLLTSLSGTSPADTHNSG